MASYHILCLDGGGIRGLYTGILLRRLAEQFPPFLQSIDLFAGTSTGGILALALAAGIDLGTIIDLYRSRGPDIFDRSWRRRLRNLHGLAGAEYDNQGLHDALAEVFGQRHLSDLPKRVLIPTFLLDTGADAADGRTWKPKFFHNYPGSDSDGAELVIEVAMRTSAAPTYFPSYGSYVDGGVVANNPSMAALAQALDSRAAGQRLEDLHLLSVGSGATSNYIEGQDLDWGLGQWARPLVSILIDGVMGVADFECFQLLGGRYHRLAPQLGQPVALDDWQDAELLATAAGEAPLDATLTWLQQNFA